MSSLQPTLIQSQHPHSKRVKSQRDETRFAGDDIKTPELPVSSKLVEKATHDGMGTGLFRIANRGVDWFVRNLYDRGPSVRYAVEQTGGYTLPRILQQWNRTRALTGQANPMAAMEMGVREILADFADTFLPGLLAKGIGRVLDKRHHTLLAKNIGSDGLAFYSELMERTSRGTYVTQPQFLERLEKRLNEVARRNEPLYEFKELKLHSLVHRIVQDKKAIPAEVKALAIEMGLPHAELRLRQKLKPFTIDLPDLLRDLRDLHMTTGITASPRSEEWGRQMHAALNKTRVKMPHQLWGLLAAGLASLSIPFGVRLITRWYYNEDSFPGTKELHDSFAPVVAPNSPVGEVLGVAPSTTKDAKIDATKKHFVLFPYLSDTLKQQNWLPSLGTAAFFGMLGLMVRRRFHSQNLSMLKKESWLKVYEFNRDAPISTLAQMELTYGLLCGTRLASSRDDSEYRETGLRDCILGWPTLTYGFAAMQKLLATLANRRLNQEFGHAALLFRDNKTIRSGAEIASHYFNNLGFGERTQAALASTRMAHRWVTFISAGINWALLAFMEPQLGIWLTNRLEVTKMEEQKKEQDEQAALLKRPPVPLPPSNAYLNPFLNRSFVWKLHEPEICAGTTH